jgi:hypothetical protein
MMSDQALLQERQEKVVRELIAFVAPLSLEERNKTALMRKQILEELKLMQCPIQHKRLWEHRKKELKELLAKIK